MLASRLLGREVAAPSGSEGPAPPATIRRDRAHGHTTGGAIPLEHSRCDRCGYIGPGAPFFSRYLHKLVLAGATAATWPLFGSAGIVYFLYFLRHQICPRCHRSWGRRLRRRSRWIRR